MMVSGKGRCSSFPILGVIIVARTGARPQEAHKKLRGIIIIIDRAGGARSQEALQKLVVRIVVAHIHDD